MTPKYFIDTCIWLNLIKKETKGKVLFWKHAQDFFKQHNDSELIISKIVINELFNHTESEQINSVLKLNNIILIDVTKEDYTFAKTIEFNSNYSISPNDCIHIAICLRINVALITRDYLLIQESKKYNILAIEPEKLLY